MLIQLTKLLQTFKNVFYAQIALKVFSLSYLLQLFFQKSSFRTVKAKKSDPIVSMNDD